MFDLVFGLSMVDSFAQAAVLLTLGSEIGPGLGPDIAQGILQGLVQSLVWLIHLLRLIPTQVLAVVAWAIALLATWQLFSAGRETVQRSQAMHKIPCANCEFFTNDHRLKCPVHPHKALTEEAVNCQDFEAARNF